MMHFKFLLAAGDKMMWQKSDWKYHPGALEKYFFYSKTVQTSRFCPDVREPMGKMGREKEEQNDQNQGKVTELSPVCH